MNLLVISKQLSTVQDQGRQKIIQSNKTFNVNKWKNDNSDQTWLVKTQANISNSAGKTMWSMDQDGEKVEIKLARTQRQIKYKNDQIKFTGQFMFCFEFGICVIFYILLLGQLFALINIFELAKSKLCNILCACCITYITVSFSLFFLMLYLCSTIFVKFVLHDLCHSLNNLFGLLL